MPEGPSLVILRELVQPFKGLRTWGKRLLIEFSSFSIRIHLLMFGTYSINERRDKPPRLSLAFTRGRELNFYTCAVRYIEGALDQEYDWSGDVLSDSWDAAAARRKRVKVA